MTFMNDNYQYNNSLRKQIVEKADIVNIINQYVVLKKNGNSFVGICPFHEDKKPSMSVSPSKKVFKCFSCGASGDVVTFISKFKNISINSAMREIGATLGIAVANTSRDIENQKNQKYYDIIKAANEFYRFYLYNTDDGKLALDYLYNRKLNNEIISRFGIGLSCHDDLLAKTLIAKNHLPLNIAEAGLIRGTNPYYDVFKDRIMFPIKDLEGNFVGFSGRVFLPNSPESKYMNSSETVVFKKSFILYNYSDALPICKTKNKVYLFEGFMDVIAAYRAGIDNAVASMGTSLTIQQIQAIKKITDNVIICYDSDGPGINATIKAIHMFVQNKMNVQIVSIPNGKDADEYINNFGQAALFDCLNNKIISAMDFLYTQEKSNLILADTTSIEIFKTNIFKHLSLFKSSTLTEKYIKTMADELSVSVISLNSDLNTSSVTRVSELYNVLEKKSIAKDSSKTIATNKELSKKYFRTERYLIRAAFDNKKSCLEIESKLSNNYVDNVHRDILYKLMAFYRNNQTMNMDILENQLTQVENDELKDIISKERIPNETVVEKLINNIVKEWPCVKANEEAKKNDNRTLEDLERTSINKRSYTKITKREGK